MARPRPPRYRAIMRAGLPNAIATESPDAGLLPDERFELIDGQLVEKESSAEHGATQTDLAWFLRGSFGRGAGGPPGNPGGWWFATGVLIEFGPGQRYRPDVSGWRRDRMPERPRGVLVTVLPDWVGEILSPGNANHDTVKKMRAYHKAQVTHYWLIDPVSQTLLIQRWTPEGYLNIQSAERGEHLRPEPFEAVELQVGLLFGDDEVPTDP